MSASHSELTTKHTFLRDVRRRKSSGLFAMSGNPSLNLSTDIDGHAALGKDQVRATAFGSDAVHWPPRSDCSASARHV